MTSTGIFDGNVTTSPTLAPTTVGAVPCVDHLDSSCDFHLDSEALWTAIWVVSLIIFLCLPFCATKPRRRLCWRRITERRWISDDTEDDWYTAAVRQQQERRRQQVQEQQRQFRTSRTQEDEIREQFLVQCMEHFTMTLAKSDLHQIHDDLPSIKRSGSQRSVGSRKSLNDSSRKVAFKNEEDSESATLPEIVDLESQAQPKCILDEDCAKDLTDNRSSSLSGEQVEEAVLDRDIDDSHFNLKVYVPLPGQRAPAYAERNDECISDKRRLVSNGCAICLCILEADEKITWSANPECPHIFHSDCVLHWYLAVGRKVQKRRLKENPELTDEEILGKLCDFPMVCPCCRRRNFCKAGILEPPLSSTVEEIR